MGRKDQRSHGVLRIGGYKLVEVGNISEGGCAFVQHVRDINSQQNFALKKIAVHDDETRRNARREGHTLTALRPYRSIVRYIAGGEDASYVYLLLELCDGPSLLALVNDAQEPLAEDMVVKVFTDVAAALSHLHKNGIAHWDVKLENIVWCRRPAQLGGSAWTLVDFGSCSDVTYDLRKMSRTHRKALEEELECRMTPSYRPPESIDLYRFAVVGRQADIWMAGCVLYALLYGSLPFSMGGALAALSKTYDWSRRWRRRELKTPIVALTDWMLESDPEKRPDAETIVELLERWNEVTPETVASKRDARYGLKASNSGMDDGREISGAVERRSRTCQDHQQKATDSPVGIEKPSRSLPWLSDFAEFASDAAGSWTIPAEDPFAAVDFNQATSPCVLSAEQDESSSSKDTEIATALLRRTPEKAKELRRRTRQRNRHSKVILQDGSSSLLKETAGDLALHTESVSGVRWTSSPGDSATCEESSSETGTNVWSGGQLHRTKTWDGAMCLSPSSGIVSPNAHSTPATGGGRRVKPPSVPHKKKENSFEFLTSFNKIADPFGEDTSMFENRAAVLGMPEDSSSNKPATDVNKARTTVANAHNSVNDEDKKSLPPVRLLPPPSGTASRARRQRDQSH